MPRATAVWLVDNTALTFAQIAEFCGLHVLEVQAIADGEAYVGMKGIDPVATGQLALQEITRCTQDPTAHLRQHEKACPARKGKKQRKYTPLLLRQERPHAVLWLVKNYPALSDAQVCTLLGTTRPTVKAIREGTHSKIGTLVPKSPVSLAFCSQEELDAALTQTPLILFVGMSSKRQ
ncbi:MAG: DUF1013 domain-containing protein [Holosporales bacterium]|jgi:hypothetical protein|nr:DUF1013 domain-containing protein [Holosporales bacterium]